ncbi:hypothetical protein ABZO31_27765 [Streptomyces sp. HUAS MG47]|uniref:hypothetical protein n=1 Tax=Streptomyces solicamelliae TaxID=3231716 RepID=UPI0038780049
MQTTALAPYAHLPRAYHGHHIASSTVDAFGRAHWLLAEREPQGHEPYDAVVVTVDDGRHTTTELSSVGARFAKLDALPDGGFVVAASRSSRDEERQVQVFDALGRESWNFRVGDAIEHLLVDESGALWVGYFDEGIFGDPLSAPGLRRWSVHGEALWTYDWRANGEISDCYALNVHGTDAWACTYHLFALLEVRSGPGTTAAHRNTIRGATALAVHGDRIAFLDRALLRTAELTDGEARPLITSGLTRPDGSPVGRRRVVSRGPRIYVQAEPRTAWNVLDISTTR